MAANIRLLNSVKGWMERMAKPESRVARFSYTDEAFEQKEIEGVDHFDMNNAQNIPTQYDTDTNPNVLDKGIRAQGASIARNFQNHFTGRVSFNLNFVVDMMVSLVNWLIDFVANDMNEYNALVRYFPDDKAYVISYTAGGEQIVKTEYIRNGTNPNGTVGIPPSDPTYWKLIRDYTVMARDITNSSATNFNTMRQSGIYVLDVNVRVVAIQNFPPIPAHTGTSSGILTVSSDLQDAKVTIQTFLFRDVGYEYTRTMSGATVVQPWYKTKDPKGLEIVGVPGLWAFRMGNDAANNSGNNKLGNLYLFYDNVQYGANNPAAQVDRETQRIQATIAIKNNATVATTISAGERSFAVGQKGGYNWTLSSALAIGAGATVTITCLCALAGTTDTGLPTTGTNVYNKLAPVLVGDYNLTMTWNGTALVGNPTYGHLLWKYEA